MTKTKYVPTVITVNGRGSFPLDMLRYDRCVPLESIDCERIDDVEYTERRTVRLVRYSEQGSKATAARWSSFGWTILTDEGK
jgi:hypothetical protein